MLLRFLGLFVPLALMLAVALALFTRSEAETRLAKARAQEQIAVGLGAGALMRALDMVERDLTFLSAHRALHEALNNGSADALGNLGEDFLRFARSKRLYDQLRWLDERGRERVRVDYRAGAPALAPPEALQDKRGRYYFEDAMRVAPGVTYVSPLDLNVERGQVERPLKPMIRIGVPLFDYEGTRRGVLLLNYFGADLLARFVQATGAAGSRAMLVNGEGYWLKAPDPADEWGFMLGAAERTMARRQPGLWQRMQREVAGQWHDEAGLWTWQRVNPLAAGMVSSSGGGPTERSARMFDAGEVRWYVVSHLDAAELAGHAGALRAMLVAPTVLLLVAFALGAWKLASAWQRQDAAEASLRAANEGLRESVAERTRELADKVAALTESDARYRTVFEGAAVGMARVATDGGFIEINDTFCELIGYRRDEVADGRMNFQQITHPDDLAADVALVGRLLRGDAASYAMEKRYRRRDGETFWVNLSVSLVRGMDGAPLYFISSVVDLTERKRLEAELRHLATADVLTGLPNRRFVIERMSNELARVRREPHKTVAVMMLDLDHFKAVNDRHGHAVGDDLLRHFAHVVEAELRVIDTFGRIGGEEFVLIQPGADRHSAVHVAERLRCRIEACPLRAGGLNIAVTASFGITLMTAADERVDDVLARADGALYAAKAAGRNRVECDAPGPSEAATAASDS